MLSSCHEPHTDRVVVCAGAAGVESITVGSVLLEGIDVALDKCSVVFVKRTSLVMEGTFLHTQLVLLETNKVPALHSINLFFPSHP